MQDILEPLLIGHSTSLQPVAVLLSIMVWGSVWGVTGMVLAVPMTAVARIHLAGLEHPLPRYLAGLLDGSNDKVRALPSRPHPVVVANLLWRLAAPSRWRGCCGAAL